MFTTSAYSVLTCLAILTASAVELTKLPKLVERHPTLKLYSYELFAINRTVVQNESYLSIPKVYDELVFECNSSVPTRWEFVGPQIDDPTVRKIEVNKWRLREDSKNFKYRSTLKILFSNPTEMINITCENICSENLKDCQYLNTFLQSREVSGVLVTSFDLLYAYGNKSVTEANELARGGWIGNNTDCNHAIHVDLDSGKYVCLNARDSKTEVPSIFIPCGNPDECDSVFKSDSENCGTVETFKPTCTHPLCSEIRNTTLPFVIACGETNEYSVAKSFFKTLDGVQKGGKKLIEFQPKNNTYPKEELVNVTMSDVLLGSSERYGIDNETIYVGYSRVFKCIALRSLFSQGILWRLRYENDTEIDLEFGKEYVLDATDLLISEKNISFDSVLIKWVVCDVPFWRSTDVRLSNFSVTVKDSIKPTFQATKNSTELVEISTNEVSSSIQTLTCLRSGTPPALVTWSFDGLMYQQPKENITSTHFSLNDTDEKSEVTLNPNHKFNEIHCIAKNVAGQAELHFKILKGPSIILTVGLPCGCLIVILILTISVLRLRRQNEVNNLTEKEIEEFQNGNPDAADAFLVPYNMDLEVSSDHFFASNEILGSGAYGKVVKGRYGVMDVAIKTVKKSAAGGYLKALLSELKIMSYVGRHPNIVNLLGACTQNIRKREISIILEFCERGDMVSLLRQNRGIFVNYFESKSVVAERISIGEYQNESVKKLCTVELVRWAVEIARGMEFLSSKNVIHGDLAGRNILITQGLSAKVSDFGLSKQLFEYSTYVQKANIPLPLRWMAYESLKDLQFSVQSDIWSYGVVLWEIFSLGETPYPGMEWGFESWKEILNGRRNDKPDFASDTLYKIMLECWNLEPNSRPCFRFLWESILDYSNDLNGLNGNYIIT
ncbi:unnamed protein product [Allacma fusca]|uniref:receptor protein-tyrosine kinase n=1 Tax=Allacma fusca TaxID=39272 RepID=A0A8J2P0D9_9HEXA|nr:unnamed protein product [Allacma fusca]